MFEKEPEPSKRDWITRTVNIFHDLKLNKLYSPPKIREQLAKNYNDSISPNTIRKLLETIVEAQKYGLQFVVNGKIRKLIEREVSNRKLYEIIEID
ncbi:MAG: hypothetical protein ACTSRH_11080 [Promethearchaeota archaeon]